MTTRNQLHLAAFLAALGVSTFLTACLGAVLYATCSRWDTEPQILQGSWMIEVPVIGGALRSIGAPKFVRLGLADLCDVAAAWLRGTCT